jgi:hypothetical protein
MKLIYSYVFTLSKMLYLRGQLNILHDQLNVIRFSFITIMCFVMHDLGILYLRKYYV